MSIHHNLPKITSVAVVAAQEHECNYNIILMNPDPEGNFNLNYGSTYEYVRDSYFEKERTNVKLIVTTDSILNTKNGH